MRKSNRPPPMDRLIRRCLRNGIKTMSGKERRPDSGASDLSPTIITYEGDRATFLALVQYDSAQMDHSFDQGKRADDFAALVERVAQEMALEEK